MAELPLEMLHLLNFPMDKLCYDLLFEVIEALEPKDVPELMKADKSFRGILLQKPARILGKQIHLISVKMDDRGSLDEGRKRYQDIVFIMKFAESTPLRFYNFTHEVLFLSQVERCSVFQISDGETAGWGNIDRKKLSALKKTLANLKQVGELEVEIRKNNVNDFLLNLKAEVTDRATFNFSDSRGETHPQLVLSLIDRSLQNCKMISVDFYLDPDFYPRFHSVLSKTQLELFVARIYGSSRSRIEWILNSGIPSENKEASCFVQGKMGFEINNLMKRFPEIRQVNEPIKTFIMDSMMETLRKHGFMDRGCDRSHIDDLRSRSDSDHSLRSLDLSPIKRGLELYVSADGPFDCYLKRIDEKRDCIYAVNDDFFFAKCVSSIQF